jgi:hypothetical protein
MGQAFRPGAGGVKQKMAQPRPSEPLKTMLAQSATLY